MFFNGTLEYHKKDNFEDAMKYLSRKNNVVCTCKMLRKKTDKPYYTFLNPECVQKIAKVKLKQSDFNMENPLLKYDVNHVNYRFKILNDYLEPIEGGLLDMDCVDLLHGRGKNSTRQSYFKDNPEYLKFEYIKAMSNISLYRRYDYKIVKGKVKVISMPL